MSRLVLASLLATVLLAGLLWLWGGLEGSGRASSSTAGPPAPVAGPRSGGPAGAPLETAAAVRDAGPDPAMVRTEVAAVPEAGTARGPAEDLEDWTLVVQVRDALGTPVADVPVSLLVRRTVEGSVRTSTKTRPTEGDQGLASFAGMRGRMTKFPGRWSVGLDLLLPELDEKELDPDAPPREPLVFHLPPAGSAEVTLLLPDHTPMPDGTEVFLGIVAEGEPRELSPFSAVERSYVVADTKDGKASFEHVALGTELEAKASHGQGAIESRAYGSGPDRPGDCARITLRVGLEHPVLLFHAVDESHAPLAEVEVELDVLLRAARITNRWDHTVTTDGAGRFRIDATVAGEGDSFFFDALLGAGDGRVARAEVHGPLGPGEHDQGALVFAPPPLVASGRVVDEGGSAIAGASVSVESRLVDQDGDVTWDRVAGGDVTTDAAGAFRVHGPAGGDALRLSASFEERRSDLVHADIGEEGILLVAPVSGGLSGRVLVDPGVSVERLEIRVLREDKTPEERRGTHGLYDGQTKPEEDGSFSLWRLRPGSYGLTVRPNDTELLASFEGLRVSAGEELEDPRVAAIDLRGRLFHHELVLVPPDGNEELRGTLRFHEAGAETEEPSFEFVAGNPVVLLSGHEAVDAFLSIRGYRGVALEDVRGRREVELQDGYPVRLVLSTEAALPDPPTYVKAVLADEDGSFGSIDWGASCFDEAREIRTEAYASGRLKVQWIVERRSGGGATASTVDVEPVQFVEVLDGPGEQVFEVEISSAELERIVRDS